MVSIKSILIEKQKWRWGICRREKLYKKKAKSDFTIIRHFCWNRTEKRFLQRVFAILSLYIPSSLGSWVFPYHKSRKKTSWDLKELWMFPPVLDDIEYWLTPTIAKVTFGNRRMMTTLEFARIREFTGARITFIFLGKYRGTVQRDCCADIVLSSAKECYGSPRARVCVK